MKIKANGKEYQAVKVYNAYGVMVNGAETAYTDEVEAINAYFEEIKKIVETEGTGTVKLKEYVCNGDVKLKEYVCRGKIISTIDWLTKCYNALDAELGEEGLELARTSVGNGEIYVSFNHWIGYRTDGTPYIRPIK